MTGTVSFGLIKWISGAERRRRYTPQYAVVELPRGWLVGWRTIKSET